MSAFVVNYNHIRELVEFASTKRIKFSYQEDGELRYFSVRGNENEAGQILWDENYRSVNHRYDEKDKTPKYKHEFSYEYQNPVQILKYVNCLEYQSCETDNWDHTSAKHFLDCIQAAAIRSLPGYENANWEAPSIKKEELPNFVLLTKLGNKRKAV